MTYQNDNLTLIALDLDFLYARLTRLNELQARGADVALEIESVDRMIDVKEALAEQEKK